MKGFEQLSLFDIELPPIEEAEKIAEVAVIEEKKEQTTINMARVPDEEFNIQKPSNVPTVNSILKMLEKGAYKVGRHELLADIFECGAIAISNQFDFIKAEEREKAYLQIINKYDRDTQQVIVNIFTEIALLLKSQIDIGFSDYLGELYMKSETSNSKAGQFFTPYHLSKMCAKVSLDERIVKERMEKDEIISLHEPAVGAGGMVIAAVDVLYNDFHFNYSRNLIVECGDIDRRCVHMCYLQLALAGVPALVYHRNGLTLETWDCWKTPAYMMQWQRFEAFERR